MLSVKIFVFNPFMENTLVVYDDHTREAAIVDCGCLYDMERNELKKFIADNNLSVKYLLNTHLHLDHQFGNAWAAAEYGVLPLAHRNDEKLIDNLPSQAMLFGIPDSVDAQPLGGYIAEGDEITIGSSKLKAIFVPGHSAGSLCFYSASDGILIVGDVLFAGSIGRTDLPGGDFDLLTNGIREKLFTLPLDTKVYPGHGPTTSIDREIHSNPFF
jgi:metallo-beta-lactamase family protein